MWRRYDLSTQLPVSILSVLSTTIIYYIFRCTKRQLTTGLYSPTQFLWLALTLTQQDTIHDMVPFLDAQMYKPFQTLSDSWLMFTDKIILVSS